MHEVAVALPSALVMECGGHGRHAERSTRSVDEALDAVKNPREHGKL